MSRPAISNACLTLLARHSDCCRMVFIPHGTGDGCKGPKGRQGRQLGMAYGAVNPRPIGFQELDAFAVW